MKKLLVLLVAVCAVATVFSPAEAKVGLKAVGVEAGWVMPEDVDGQSIDGTFGYGLYLDFGMPMTGLTVSPFVNFWSQNMDAGQGSSVDFSDVSFGGALKWAFVPSPVFSPFLTAGAAAHMLKAEFTSSNPLFSGDASDTKMGYHVGGGAEFNVNGTFSIVGQALYNIVDGNNQTVVKGGLAFNL